MNKILFLIISTFLISFCRGQDLPINKETKLISVIDSFKTPKEFNLNGLQNLIRNWNIYIGVQSEAEKAFGYDGIKNQLSITFFNPEIFKNTSKNYSQSASMNYFGRTKSLGQLMGQSSSGQVNFNVNYQIKNTSVVYEFTNFEFLGLTEDDGNKEKFENEKVTNYFVFAKNPLANNKKIWNDIKVSYIERFKILSNNFKKYATSNLTQQATETNSDPINYNNYKNIKDDMTYDEVVKILGDEGKELSSTKIKEGNTKTIEKVIQWIAKDSSKTITITFQDEKVSNKAQTKL